MLCFNCEFSVKDAEQQIVLHLPIVIKNYVLLVHKKEHTYPEVNYIYEKLFAVQMSRDKLDARRRFFSF